MSLVWDKDTLAVFDKFLPGFYAGADLGLLKGGWPIAKPERSRGPGHAPRNFLVFAYLKWHFQHFESHF